MNLKNILLRVSLIGMPFFSYAQQVEIKGTISDSISKPIVGAIITANTSNNSSNILAYTSTSSSGTYNLKVNNSDLDSIWLNIKHISFKTVEIKIALRNGIKNIKLSPKAEQLQEVIIQTQKKIKISGDTITYNVEGLKAEKDYTIEEVISRIPGVTISESGQIKYREKNISHLYINGIDLLEGRYNIATRGIPADAVREIDVMTKHNHERINIGRTDSDKVALNLHIKENQSVVFGSVKAEAGAPFLTGAAEATPIYLKNKFQSIGSLKSNNIGESLKSTGASLTNDDLNIFLVTQADIPIIRPPNTNGLVVSNKYWLDNDSYAVTNDALHKINDSILVKWNVNYNNELSSIQKNSVSTYLINADSTVVSNRTKNQLQAQRFQVGFVEEINKRNIYVKNNTNFRYFDSRGLENVVLNQNEINANYQNFNTQFNNTTTLKTVIRKKNILMSGLVVEYAKQSEQLQVKPPVFLEILGNSLTSEATQQNVDLGKFNVGGYTSYAFDWIKLNWKINQKVQYNNYRFKSQLSQKPEPISQNFPFSSDFDYQKFLSSTNLTSRWNLGRMKFTWSMSADFIDINTRERNAANLEQSESFFFLQPVFSAGYKLNSKWDLGVSYSQSSSISDFSELYQGVILTDFNMIAQNPQIINKTSSKSLIPFISYSDILKSFLFTIKANLGHNQSGVTFVNQLNDLGFLSTSFIKRPNSVKNQSLSLNFSKAILGSINTTLGYTLNAAENELFFNNQFINAENLNQTIDFGFTWDNGKWYTLEYKANSNRGTSRLQNNKIDNSFLFHSVNLDFYASPTTQIHFGAESARATTSSNNNVNKNTLFNMRFLYKSSKKLYFRAALNNIFDTSSFLTTFGSANAVTISQFSLRPRQFTIGLTYSL